ncbi:MAG: glucoamylase family protein [Ignavibacteriaceae bacterium]
MKTFKMILLVVFVFVGCKAQQDQLVFTSKGKVDYQISQDDIKLLDSIQYRSFLFFVNEANPENGLVKDKNWDDAPSSIASVGFALPSYAVGVERNWITREKAAQLTLNTLKFFYNSTQSEEADATGFKGLYYHFLKMDSGKREWNCELSTIDTGILMMGIIFARNYFDLDKKNEIEIRSLAKKLLERIEWEFFIMDSKGKDPNTVSMGWLPNEGLHHMGWSGYNEALFLYVLAAGSGMKGVEQAYNSWLSTYDWRTPYPELSHVAFPPMFGHQFAHTFIDFRGLTDKFMKEKGIDYFENSRRAALVQKNYAIDNPHNWIGYDSLCWGISASDGPGDKYNFDDKKFYTYAGRGTSGVDLNYFDDGTIAPYASLASIVFEPELVLKTINSMNEKYGSKLWGKYGIVDSFNPTANWFCDTYYGIVEGPKLLMIENFRSGLVWNYVMKDKIIQDGLDKLEFENIK